MNTLRCKSRGIGTAGAGVPNARVPSRTAVCQVVGGALCAALLGLYVAPAAATPVVLHSGSADPVSEGWSHVGAGAGVIATAVPSDVGGYAAWKVEDTAVFDNSSFVYTMGVDALDASLADTQGWQLSTRLRVGYANDPVDASVHVNYFDGSTQWLLQFGAEPDGDAIVEFLGGSSYTSQGSGSVHHLFEMVYDAGTATVDLFVDGIERISNFAGVPTASDPAYVGFGSGSVPNNGNGIYNLVQLEIVPEPSSIALMGLGMAAIGGCAWRRRKV